ncbi:Rrf2 family transcriptional regulator, partial [bacterium]|nr:Rrf2 family transcriptional regulator [bacterium]
MLIKISEAASLAIHTMVFLVNQRSQSNTTKGISSVLRASGAHISKVMQRLVKAGFVKSTRGPSGGFVIIDQAEKASLLDIYEAIDGKIVKPTCLFKAPICDSSSCVMGTSLISLCQQLIDYLKNTKLMDIPMPKIPNFPPNAKKLSSARENEVPKPFKRKKQILSNN